MMSINRIPQWTSVVSAALLLSACSTGPSAGDTSISASPSAGETSSPNSSAAACLRPLRDLGSGRVLGAPCTYVLDYFPVDLIFDVPAGDGPGWHVGKSSPDAAILIWNTPPEIIWLIGFWNVDNVYVDPCDAAAGELDPPVGPSVDDFVTALSNLPGFEVSAPVDVTVGAFRGKQIELTALDSGDDCPQALAWSAGEDKTDLGPGEARDVLILDVDGVRIVMITVEPEQPDPAVQAQFRQIVDSIRIGPPS